MGDPTPDGVQDFLARARGDADAGRDELRAYVAEPLGEAGAGLVLDETNFVKHGDRSVGVYRQYLGTAGRVENCQVAVFLGYAGPRGHALIDRAPDRLTPCAWVAAHGVYGTDPGLRRWLETRRVGYVLAVTSGQLLAPHGVRERVDEIADALPADAWERLSAGDGAKGPRLYGWANVPHRGAAAGGKPAPASRPSPPRCCPTPHPRCAAYSGASRGPAPPIPRPCSDGPAGGARTSNARAAATDSDERAPLISGWSTRADLRRP